ncbi:hypothetical protein KUCAC02_020608, partial [Chaenocephalus aceratus]
SKLKYLFSPSYLIGVRRPPELDKTNHSVHYTLLIACVLGGVRSLAPSYPASWSPATVTTRATRPRNCRRIQRPRSLTPCPCAGLAKLNGLLDSQSKDDKLEVSSPKIYNSFFANSKEHHTPRRNGHHAMTMGDLVHPQHTSTTPQSCPVCRTPDSNPRTAHQEHESLQEPVGEEPELPTMPRNQNPTTPAPGPSSALLHPQVFPYSHSLSNGQPLMGGYLPSSMNAKSIMLNECCLSNRTPVTPRR